MWIVIVERDDADPLVVGFDDEVTAIRWSGKCNEFAEREWPNSYHNYARPEVRTMDPGVAWNLIHSDVYKRQEEEVDDG